MDWYLEHKSPPPPPTKKKKEKEKKQNANPNMFISHCFDQVKV